MREGRKLGEEVSADKVWVLGGEGIGFKSPRELSGTCGKAPSPISFLFLLPSPLLLTTVGQALGWGQGAFPSYVPKALDLSVWGHPEKKNKGQDWP